MAVRPNFKDSAQLGEGQLKVSGRTADGPAPAVVHVFIEQGQDVQNEMLEQPPHEWEMFLHAGKFVPGPATAFGIEVHLRPFQSATWTQNLKIV